MKALARMIFEASVLSPPWAALVSGYAAFGLDGQLYLTEAGEEYLQHIGEQEA